MKKCLCYSVHHTVGPTHLLKSEGTKSNHGQWCGSGGREVASNSRVLRFKSSHREKFILNLYYQLDCKDKNKRKRGREWTIFLQKQSCPLITTMGGTVNRLRRAVVHNTLDSFVCTVLLSCLLGSNVTRWLL